MRVILEKNVKNLGKMGEIKEVADGYARNFLFPNFLAKLATKHSIQELADKKRKKSHREKQTKALKSKLAKDIKGREFSLFLRADKNGTLYAAIKKEKIIEVLAEEGFLIDNNEISIKKPIKKVGVYKINLKILGKTLEIKLKVMSEKKPDKTE